MLFTMLITGVMYIQNTYIYYHQQGIPDQVNSSCDLTNIFMCNTVV